MLKLIRDSASLILGGLLLLWETSFWSTCYFQKCRTLNCQSFRTIPTVGWILILYIWRQTDIDIMDIYANGRYPFPLYLNPNLNADLPIFFLRARIGVFWNLIEEILFLYRNFLGILNTLCTLISSNAGVSQPLKRE